MSDADSGAANSILASTLAAAHKIAARLSASVERSASLMPLDAPAMTALSTEQAERLDALIQRFTSLLSMVQDRVVPAVLRAEDEDVRGLTHRDQRLLLERLGVLDPAVEFGALVMLRNRLAHHYPDDQAKQADIINQVATRAPDLIAVLSVLDAFARRDRRDPWHGPLGTPAGASTGPAALTSED